MAPKGRNFRAAFEPLMSENKRLTINYKVV